MYLDLVDVFGSGPLSGNPLAVVHGGEGLDEGQMLRLTRWLGFSETTFLLPPTDPAADYRVRIFYPAGELPFAGHPTLGSAFAWLASGGVPRQAGVVVQECAVGLIPVKAAGDRLAFAAPPLTRSGPLDAAELAEAVRVAGVDPADVVEAVHIANGPQWQLLRLASASAVLAARPAPEAPIGTDVGVAAPADPASGADWELRAFFANQHGKVTEDPVTGSFNAGLAMHLFASGLAKGFYRAAQGRRTGADGLVELTRDANGTVWVGGRCAMVSQGGQVDAV
ncbi:PhzF family phenazine biosynthesis isomerase [Altererythrobacter buctensis]|uniref:PhzF family phenazine biosynthesis isomerase n=1 Tax=Alteraurantiacibacter buctensis TaxID=1503981 RepID=A0A844YWF3_9SPHN|nr:PhzF family phenazine biosynthesis protein [Alteraurantiacibacter buctensis]MXO71462.1 PhzF family phenazine biosynthesis isomerase [Alteraurantiacibacter buctensis]